MLVLNKKKLSIILLVILFGIFAITYKNEEKEIQPDQYASSTPVSNKVVVLDAGHGVPDE